jgi:hypothetical protein
MGKKKKTKKSRKNRINNTPQSQKITEEKEYYVSKGYEIYIFLCVLLVGMIFLFVYLFGLIIVLIK